MTSSQTRSPVIYVSVPSTAAQNGDSVIAIDATSGTILKSVSAGSETQRIAVSGDGQYLYVAIDGASSVKRFLLPALTKRLRRRLTWIRNDDSL